MPNIEHRMEQEVRGHSLEAALSLAFTLPAEVQVIVKYRGDEPHRKTNCFPLPDQGLRIRSGAIGKMGRNFGMKRTTEEVANTIDGFINGTGNQWTWDGFTSIRLDEPELEAVRQKIVALPVEFPPSNPRDYCNEAGMQKMRQIVQELRARSSSGATV